MLYYGKKLVIFMISVGLLSLVTFYVSRLAPGDPLFSYYGERVEKMSPEEREWAEEKLGLNDKISVQYSRWIHQVFHGNFGRSYKYKMDVLDVLKSRLGNTLLLGGTGFLIIFAGALLLGVICAWKEGGWLDKIICKAGTIISCVPEFWLALVLILVFSVSLRWLPSSGAYAVGQEKNISDRILHMILPLTVIVTEHLWYYGYMVRNKMLDEIRADYVLMAKAKGIKKSRIMLVHCMRNIMPSYLSIMAISVTHIMGGTYVAETVFSYPGIGTLAYESARYKDYNLLMIISLMSGIIIIARSYLRQRLINQNILPLNLLCCVADKRIFADNQSCNATIGWLISVIFIQKCLKLCLNCLCIQCFRFHNGLLWIDAGCQAIVLTCHDHFTHQWIQSQLILNLLRRYIFTVGQDDQVLHTSIDKQITVFIHIPLVTGMQPAIL